jgi:nucleotide-binding universal stress UspA family protein
VSEPPGRNWRRRAMLAVGLEEEIALKEIVSLAEAHGVAITTTVQRSGAPAAAIVRRAHRAGRDLIVLGVSRHQGDRLFFGKVPAEVLRAAPCSVLLISS